MMGAPSLICRPIVQQVRHHPSSTWTWIFAFIHCLSTLGSIFRNIIGSINGLSKFNTYQLEALRMKKKKKEEEEEEEEVEE